MSRLSRLVLLSLMLWLGWCFLSPAQAEELTTPEIQLEMGYGGVSTLGGCCRSSSARLGGGITLDIPRMFREVDFEFRGVSTGKYSELSVGPRIYLLGGATEIMPDLAPGMHVSKVDHHSLLGSVGLGLATHSTTTTEFDLPTLVGSVLVYGRINYVFAVSERWGVGTVVSASLNITANYMSLAYFLSVGPRYKF